MTSQNAPGSVPRRTFLLGAAGLTATASISPAPSAAAQDNSTHAQKVIGIQIGAVSFVDEGIDQALDLVQQRGQVNTIFLAAFTFGRGIAGRQVPGQPLPDHGGQEYDQRQFHGGNYATPVEGYTKLAAFVRRSLAGDRPDDGYFVTFWRLLLDYPEILAWEKLWTDGKHAIYANIYHAAKSSRPGVQVGFHIWHANSFSPFFRAEQDYAACTRNADYLKVVLYDNCGGPRYVQAINNIGSTIFRDVPRDELLGLSNHLLGYDEKGTTSCAPQGCRPTT